MASSFNQFNTIKKEGHSDTCDMDEKPDTKDKYCMSPLIWGP